MDVRYRKLLTVSLLAAFATQGFLVYTDETAAKARPLSPAALEGRAIWQGKNCAACHQLYGFGGFLGGDLTNAARHLTRERLDRILTTGSLQMPAFHLSPAEIDAVQAFLSDVDRTGVGQLGSRGEPSVPWFEFR